MKAEKSVTWQLSEAKAAGRKGELDRARELYEAILARYPKNRKAQVGLAALGRDGEKIDRRLTAIFADYRQGEYAKALEAVIAYLNEAPQHKEARELKAACLRMVGRPDEALELYQARLDEDPGEPELWDKTGSTLVEMLKLTEAEKCLLMAVRLDPDRIPTWLRLTNCYQRRGDHPAAYNALTQALGRDPANHAALDQLGQVLRDMGRTELALDAHEQALKNARSDIARAAILANIGVIRSAIGDIPGARDSYFAALKAESTNVHALTNLSTLGAPEDTDQLIDHAKGMLKNANLSNFNRSQLNFALFRLIDRRGDDPAGAFEHLSEANAIRRRLIRHSPEQHSGLFRVIRMMADATPIISEATPGARPVFIVGLPRSGTTLTEQMLSAAPGVHAAGELTMGDRIALPLLQRIEQEDRSGPTLEEMHFISTELREAMTAVSHGQPVILDKMPLNFRWVGLLLSALPDAKFINVHRDPVETCWSNFISNFSSHGNGFVYGLTDLVHYHALYEDLTAFWAQRYPDRFRTIHYEELVSTPEPVMRDLVDYAGLEWDDSCLHPENVDRAVLTASVHQVRQAIYNGNRGKWRPYAPFISPLLDAFGEPHAA